MLKLHRRIGFPSILSRSMIGHRPQTPKGGRKGAVALLAGGALIVGCFLLIPRPPPRLRDVALSDEQLRNFASSTRLPPTVWRGTTAQAQLGRRLFTSKDLGPHPERACTSCHAAAEPPATTRSERDTLGTAAAPRARPGLANLDPDGWFRSDGRSDSLAAACLAAIEDPIMSAGSRLGAIQLVGQRFRLLYEDAFGPWPMGLEGLPAQGRPAPSAAKLPINVAAQGLASLGSFPLLEGILNIAQQQHATPAVELSRRAFREDQAPPAWTAAFAALTPEQQLLTNEVYANLGLALAAYLTGLSSGDSPYDRFAARMLQGHSAMEALGEGFGADELIGLKLFAGPAQCHHCHHGPRFSDGLFHNIGLAQIGTDIDAGRAAGLQIALLDPFNCRGSYLPQNADTASSACKELRAAGTSTGRAGDLGAYKTPSLRNASRRGPFMHDGRFQSLTEVVQYFNELRQKPAIGSRDPLLHPLDLTHDEAAAIVSFLTALNAPERDSHLVQTATARP